MRKHFHNYVYLERNNPKRLQSYENFANEETLTVEYRIKIYTVIDVSVRIISVSILNFAIGLSVINNYR